MNRMLRMAAPGVLAIAALPASAWAFASWSNPSGSTSLFSWSGGQNNDVNLFGSPTVVGNSFIFTPQNFAAISSGGSATATDTLQVVITVNPGQTITGVSIHEFGTRSSSTFTTLQGTERVKDLSVGGLAEIIQNVPITPTAPDWTADGSVTGLTFGDTVSFQLTLTNSLTALLGANIRKNGVQIDILPTPGVLAVAGGMLGVAGLRRRR